MIVTPTKKDDPGKSGRMGEIKISPSKKEGKFSCLQSSEKPNLVILKAMIRSFNRMKSYNQDIVVDKSIKDDDDNLVFDDKSKLRARKSHYKKLFNFEDPWDSSTLSEEQPLQGPPIRITTEMVSKALTKMKKRHAAGPSGLNVEMILAGGNDIIVATTHLVNCVVAEG